MRELYRDVRHLLRVVALFAAGAALFVLARAALVPDDFGVYGHYRAGAIEDARARVPVFAGREVCATCHDDVVEARAGGAHDGVGCEACHGALADHADDPESVRPERPAADELCAVCHRASPSRPAWFPQVDPVDHAMGDPCDACHEPHRPGFE